MDTVGNDKLVGGGGGGGGGCWYVINCLSKVNPSVIEFVSFSIFCDIFSIIIIRISTIHLINLVH